VIKGGIKTGLAMSISEVGKIKIGGKGEERTSTKPGKKKYRLAVRFGHFKVTTTERGEDGNFLPDEAVMGEIGDKPKELAIRFPFDDIHMNFQTSYQYYDSKKQVCQGDGVHAERKDKDGQVTKIKCDLETCEFMKSGKCKPSGRMSCYLPDSPHRGGIYRFRTHGWNSVGGILAALQDYSKYTDGVLQGLPFKLVFTKKATEEHGNVPVVALVLDGVELNQMRDLASAERQARIEFGRDTKIIEQKAVVAGVMEDTDKEEDVAEEFYGEIEDGDEPDEAGASSEDVQDVMEEKDAKEKAEPSEKPKGKKPDLF